MPARLVCSGCGKLMVKSDTSVELGRDTIGQCPKCKRELPLKRESDRVFVEGGEIGLIT